MKIVMLDGGFANQMTQCIFARCLQEATDDTVFLDDLYFHVPTKPADMGHFQLKKFPNLAKVPLISEYFDRDVWEEIVQRSIALGQDEGGSRLPQILKDSGLEFFMIAEPPTYHFDGMVARMPYYHYFPEMLQAQGNVYYFGYFSHGGWFMSHEEIFRHEFALPAPESKEDMETIAQIENSYAVGVHIRCAGGFKAQGIAFPPEYYKKNIAEICKFLNTNKNSIVKKPHFFIFSDDISWCVENMESLGLNSLPYPFTFGQTDRGPHDNHNDMKLLSMCDVLLLNNSIYGYMAALLNHKPNKIVLNPVKSRGIF